MEGPGFLCLYQALNPFGIFWGYPMLTWRRLPRHGGNQAWRPCNWQKSIKQTRFLAEMGMSENGVPHCTQWFCWSWSLLNGYNWEYTLFSDKPKWWRLGEKLVKLSVNSLWHYMALWVAESCQGSSSCWNPLWLPGCAGGWGEGCFGG